MPKSTTRKRRGSARSESFQRSVIVIVVACLGWWFRYWPEEHVAGHFRALQRQDYNTAYGIWMQDPQWQQHPEQASKISVQ